jgi:thiol-disulfide isomerase/thioredoxin
MPTSLLCLLAAAEIATGTWTARLDAPGGPLPFVFEIAKKDEHTLSATVVNGSERIEVPLERRPDGRFVFAFPHYAAQLTATLDENGRALDGEWTKRAGPSTSRTLPFHAAFSSAGPRANDAATTARIARISGRWRVHFEKDADPAVALFAASTASPGGVEGTFLTTTGDFRYLAGNYDEHLILSCFDGAHAFRFAADLQPDGTLKGTFSSGSGWTDAWTAVRDDSAKLPDEFGRVHWDDSYAWNDLWFPDDSGALVSLGDPRFDGRVRILQVTGSWCPNCHDETALLAQLDREYRAQGLSITALCFELTGERDTDTQAARRMLERHGAAYPGLLVGRSDKQLAGEAFPALDRVFAFPTTILVGRDGRVRAVHTGFSGPATGKAYEELRADFRRRIEELLAEKPVEDEALREKITLEIWRDELKRTFTTIARDESGTWRFSALEMTRFDAPTRTDPVDAGTVAFHGTTVLLGKKAWTYDRHAHVLLDPSDCGQRFTPATRSPFPVVDGVGYSEFAQVLEGLSNGNPIRRRESAYYLALQILADRTTPPEFGGGQIPSGTETNLAPLLADPDPRVRATASWAVGAVGLSSAVAALEKNLAHGYAPVRREAARALMALDAKAARASLAPLADHDLDPLVRAAAAR